MMKVRTHHWTVLGIGVLAIPMLASAWIAFRYLGGMADFRPWLIVTARNYLSNEIWWLSLQIGMVGAIGIGALMLYLLEGVVLGVDNSDLHGSAEWSTYKQAKKAMVIQDWGVVLGRFKETTRADKALKRSDAGHSAQIMRTNAPDYANIFLSAPPRSGKGTGVIIPTLLEYPGSFMVYDVKGENFMHTARARAAMGDKVRVFSPFPITLENGLKIHGQSHGFNPLVPIKRNRDLEDRISDIDVMATALLSASNSKDAGLLSSGREIFKAICAIVCDEEDVPSLGKVVDLLTPMSPDGEEIADLSEHFKALSRRAPEPLSRDVLVAAAANKNENNALYLSVLFDAGLKAWRNPNIRRATETHDFDFEKMRAEPYSIYLVIPTPNKQTAAPVVRLFFQLALRTLQLRIPDKDQEPFTVLFMIDEFHSLGKMPEVLDAPTVIPGYGGRIVTVVQTPASLDEIYGRDAARIFLDVMQLKIFMTPNDNQTKKMIEEMLGYTTMISQSVSAKSLGKGDPRSHSFSEIRRPLMSADDIGKMPKTKQLVTVQGESPIYCERIRYFSDPYFKPIYDRQEDLPWPIDDIPVVKANIVTRGDDFLVMPNERPKERSQPVEKPVAANDAPANATEITTGQEPAETKSVHPLLLGEPDESAGSVPDLDGTSAIQDERNRQLLEQSFQKNAPDPMEMERSYVRNQVDFSVLVQADCEVTGNAEQSRIAQLVRSLSPGEIAKGASSIPDDKFDERPDLSAFRSRQAATAQDVAR